MAKVRTVVGDQSSAEIDQLRDSVNGILAMLENLAGSTFTEVADLQEALANSIALGVDADFTTTTSTDSYVGSGAEVVGARVMNAHPRRPGFVKAQNLKEMKKSDYNG